MGAIGDVFLFFGVGGVVYALDVLLVDAAVAGGTRRRNVAFVNGRPVIRMLQDQVGTMTVDTDRTGEQTLFREATAMDTARVVGENPDFREIGRYCGRSILTVTPATKTGDVCAVGEGVFVVVSFGAVVSVAGRAIGCLRGFVEKCLPVSAGVVFLRDFGVAVGAIYSARRLAGAVQAGVDIRMAFDAWNILVD